MMTATMMTATGRLVLAIGVLVVGVPFALAGGRVDFLGSMVNSGLRMAALVPFAVGLIMIVSGIVAAAREAGRTEPWYSLPRPIATGTVLAVAAEYLLYDWPAILAYAVVLFVTLNCLARNRPSLSS